MKNKYNKTYKGVSTKRIKKEFNIIKTLFITLVIGTGILNSILANPVKKFANQVISSAVKTSVVTPSTKNDYEKLSDGTEVIELKTKSYEKEMTIRLAAEQACDYVGAEKMGVRKQCIEDLVGIAWTETKTDPFNCKLVGDLDFNGSYGCFQINRYYHPEITREQAEDPYFAAKWTAKRLVSKGYPVYRSNAIRLHNGGLDNPKTLTYLNSVNKIALQ